MLHDFPCLRFTESHATVLPLNGSSSSTRRLSGAQGRRRASTIVHSIGAAHMQASSQASASLADTMELAEKIADPQLGQQGTPDRLSNSALLRRLTAVTTANEALDIFLQDNAVALNLDALQGFTEASASSKGLAWKMVESSVHSYAAERRFHFAKTIARHYLFSRCPWVPQ